MTIVPAVLAIAGDRAWWLPARLRDRLPDVDIEGRGLARRLGGDAVDEPAGTSDGGEATMVR